MILTDPVVSLFSFVILPLLRSGRITVICGLQKFQYLLLSIKIEKNCVPIQTFVSGIFVKITFQFSYSELRLPVTHAWKFRQSSLKGAPWLRFKTKTNVDRLISLCLGAIKLQLQRIKSRYQLVPEIPHEEVFDNSQDSLRRPATVCVAVHGVLFRISLQIGGTSMMD